MAEIKWILTCEGNCPERMEIKEGEFTYGFTCPQECPNSCYEKEQLNTEVPSDG